MPILNDEGMDQFGTGNFGFSATRIDELGATEYTLVSIALDVSPSVSGFKDDLEKMVAAVISACQKSPRSDNLMIRLITFCENRTELHGFKLLEEIKCGDPQSGDLGDYENAINISGHGTALFDASIDSIGAVKDYGEQLAAPGNDFAVNSIIFVITDGDDNSSGGSAQDVKKKAEELLRSELVESTRLILIGVNDAYCKVYLDDFHKVAAFDQFVSTGDVTPHKLAKLADFVSQSVSSQSQALGTGGSSVKLTF